MNALERFRELALEFREAARDGDAEGMGAILAERRALLRDLEAARADRPVRVRAFREILDLDRQSESILAGRGSELRDELVALARDRRGPGGATALTNQDECRKLAVDRLRAGLGGEGDVG